MPWRIMTFIFAMLLLAAAAHATPVPVFRDALEHREPDGYELWFNMESLALEQRLRMKRIKTDARETGSNLSVTWLTDKGANPLAAETLADLPPFSVVLVYCPAREKDWEEKVVYTAPLDEIPNDLLTSPARESLVQKIVAGDSAVWLLIESGDKAKDESALNTLTATLEKFQKAARPLPGIQENPEIASFHLTKHIPFKIAFSTLSISRNDPAEKAFIQLLFGLYPNLAKSREPIMFPVFGRGCCLDAAVGTDIRPEVIKNACEILTGPSEKDGDKIQIPGHDLLMAANWEALLQGKGGTPIPQAAILPTPEAPETPAALAPIDTSSQNGILGITLTALLLLIAIAVVVVLYNAAKRRQPK